ncbi:MAG: undecaprenyl/decaprenyl-phosphate alpha-N-acetylglucosaminyl 1-phosphate transferase, partial [Acidobacteria bacterium]|nr:undecaprenyl/decaprenyl-phosphate alpha-N-acetylglucosaminyl 1-phosphate transferase [Acidobacteriota bacterium]
MKTYVSLFVLSTLLSVLLTPLAKWLAGRWGVVDYPDPVRRFHQQPIPRLGGVAIYLSFLFTLAIIPLLNNLVADQLRLSTDQVLRLLIPCTLVFLLGIYDDIRGANARIKFTVQILASLLVYALGLRITHVWHPFGGTVDLGIWALPLTVLWLVGITNAFNLIDGLDGLSAGAALFAILTVLVVALIHGHPLIVLMSIALAGATFGFLRYNFAPASVFMGDSGSLFLGFAIAALALEGSQKSTTAVAVAIPIVSLGLPILDTVWAMVRRLLGKRPVFTGDREHIHHMIVKRGLSIRQSIILLYGVCALFALFSLLFLNPNGQLIGLVLFIVGFCVFLGIQRLGYHEVTEIRYALRKVWGQRHIVAANINVRRAAS